jgi:hypothetical protein
MQAFWSEQRVLDVLEGEVAMWTRVTVTLERKYRAQVPGYISWWSIYIQTHQELELVCCRPYTALAISGLLMMS